MSQPLPLPPDVVVGRVYRDLLRAVLFSAAGCLALAALAAVAIWMSKESSVGAVVLGTGAGMTLLGSVVALVALAKVKDPASAVESLRGADRALRVVAVATAVAMVAAVAIAVVVWRPSGGQVLAGVLSVVVGVQPSIAMWWWRRRWPGHMAGPDDATGTMGGVSTNDPDRPEPS